MAACAPAEEDDQDNNNGNVGDNNGDTNNGDDYTDDDDGDGDTNEGAYADGNYEAFGDQWDHGQESATVVIADGEITEVYLKRLTTDGEEVDYELWKGEEIDGKLYPNLKQFKEDMATSMIEAQSYDVDIISGATTSTENWKLAAQRALEEAAK